MASPKKFPLSKLVIGFLYQDEAFLNKALHELYHVVGEADIKSNTFEFNHSTYYQEELGNPIQRCWVAFKNLIEPSKICDVKHICGNLEKSLSHNEKRRINIDPGMLSQNNFILTSFKNFAHRIPLQSGVYADLTLFYKEKKGFMELPWTYPDYKSFNFLKFLSFARERYRMLCYEEKS